MSETPLALDDPRMLAWAAYKATPEYQNTRKWALYEEHVDGSLWAALLQGYESRTPPDVSDLVAAAVAEAVKERDGYHALYMEYVERAQGLEFHVERQAEEIARLRDDVDLVGKLGREAVARARTREAEARRRAEA